MKGCESLGIANKTPFDCNRYSECDVYGITDKKSGVRDRTFFFFM
jgi:hypothetical protein